ncbi:heparanase-like protein 3 [Dorcoceras hygrometricum]|uniref:Heparanase-like protein 3 n=1 Tax=Dorcoceras hygrometricum TaxID=472368 RepID=A0A2Z7DDP0_9LAMI|nr:heparanase-like protein 3 [Dorcoceras hygrometricum]
MSMFKLLGLSFWLYFGSGGSSKTAVPTVNGTIRINGSAPIGIIDEDFICATMDWWPPTKCDYGTCSWGNASVLNLDLSNKILLSAIKAFSPLKIRLGGTLQDKLIYQTTDDQAPCKQFVNNSSEMFGFTQGCLPMSRWDELNNFFKTAKAKVIFGLNALNGRMIASNGTCSGAWNSSNAEYLMRRTVNSGYNIHGWELGNELSGSGVGASVAAEQYVADVINLQKVVKDIYKNFEVKPLILGPGGFFDARWYTKFVDGASQSLDVVTHHIYNLGPGVDDHLIDKILDPSYLDGASKQLRSLQQILNNSGASTVAWVSEAGGAYNSGRNLVTNAFVFSFWYLDQLGMASSYDTKTYCRQSLIGGNYERSFTSYNICSALLWHRLMGRNVLSTSFVGTNKLRAYAHCSKESRGITLLLINLDNSSAVEVNGLSALVNGREDNMIREEYHLTAEDGDFHSRNMLLNGQILSVNSSGLIPALEPVRVKLSEPIVVAPLSIVFEHIPSIDVPACRTIMGSRRLHECSQELILPIPTIRIESVLPSTQLRVIFNFACSHHHQYILSRNSTELELLRAHWSYSPAKQIQFNPQITARSKEKMFRALKRGLVGFRLSIRSRRRLAEWTVEQVWDKLASSMSRSNNQLTLDVDFDVLHRRVLYEDRDIRESVLMEGTAGPNMIPSSEASIESLESKIVDSSDESCSICLEDFQAGCECVYMPCFHVFHGGCIKTWLRASHYCPVCRYQMPTRPN